MRETTQMTSKSNIGDNSSYNNVFQNSSVHNPLFVSNIDLIGILSQQGHHEVIQDYFHKIMSSIRISHKLFPDFGVKHHLGLNRLISNPETEDAFDKYPKIIKSTFQVDYKLYPHINKSESILEYAYRTQQVIKLKTLAYKEYLGDVEDPYPLAVYEDGMMTTITPPDFPPSSRSSNIFK